jgi:alkylated DNA repair dioxygenase AlkB
MKTNKNHNIITLQDADLSYYPKYLNQEKANYLYNIFLKDLAWEQHYIKLFGKTIAQPRLSALYASNTRTYKYSGLQLSPKAYTEELKQLNELVSELTGHEFTHCLTNLYRDGNDSMGWHADNEKELGNEPTIASLSLGMERNFQLKHKINPDLKHTLKLEHGSLLIMKGSTQEFWKHQLPKTKKAIGSRINLTFRTIF